MPDKPVLVPILTLLEQIVIALEKLRDNVVQGSPIHVDEIDGILRNVRATKTK